MYVMDVLVGSNFTLECVVFLDPCPVIYWSKEGEPLEESVTLKVRC